MPAPNKFYKQLEKELNIKFDKQNPCWFDYEGMELYYSVWDYDKPVKHVIACRGKALFKLEDTDFDSLVIKLKKNKEKYKAKFEKYLRKSTSDENNQTLITSALYHTEVKAELRFDGQNLTIRTGKDPNLINYILSCLESYENDPMVKLVYK